MAGVNQAGGEGGVQLRKESVEERTQEGMPRKQLGVIMTPCTNLDFVSLSGTENRGRLLTPRDLS